MADQGGASTRTAQHPAHRRAGLAVLAIAIAAALLWSRASDRADAQTLSLATAPASSYAGTEFRPWLVGGVETPGPGPSDSLDAATEILTVEREAVQCERPLELTLLVHEANGTPVHNAEIVCDWQDHRGSDKLRATTNKLGVARLRRWIPASEFGRITRIRVHVETPDWRAERWVWFIPR